MGVFYGTMLVMKDNVLLIVNRIQDILDASETTSPEIIGGYIVGTTIVRDDIDTFYKEYPILEEIAELGAELETARDQDYGNELLEQIQVKFHILLRQVHRKFVGQ
jgi:hypothetical protein